MHIQPLNRITPIASHTAVQLTRCFRSTILLTHKLGLSIEMAIERVMNDPTYLVVPQQPPVLGQEHQSSGGQEFLDVHELGQSPVDHNLIHKIEGHNTMTVRGSRT